MAEKIKKKTLAERINFSGKGKTKQHKKNIKKNISYISIKLGLKKKKK